jgi:uncharacterized protein (DUF302 family)
VTDDVAPRFEVESGLAVPQAVEAVREALAARGFSVLWELDVKAKLEEKGQQLSFPYRILEVCNAPRAREALETNPEVGFYLPCKVVVYGHGGGTRLGLVAPESLIGLLDDARLEPLATEVGRVLREALAAAGAATGAVR